MDSLLALIGGLAALLTVGSAVVYLLGLIGLAWPIYARITNNASTAWYTVSLIPRTVVAGHGARIWMRFPLAWTTVLVLFWTIWRLVEDASSLIFGTRLLGEIASGIILGITLYAFFHITSRYEPKATQSAALRIRTEYEDFWNHPLHQVVIATYVLGLAILILALSFSHNVIDVIKLVPPKLDVNWFNAIWTTLLLFVASFLFGVSHATSIDPPLLTAKIVTKFGDTTTKETLNTLEGILVAHSDSFWHIFDENNELLSIPDEQVLTVRLVRTTDTRYTEGTVNAENTKQE